MGKGSNTQSTSQSQTTAPGNPNAVDAYNRLFGQSKSLEGQAWNPATAQQIAGLSAPQQQALSNVSGGIASPYIAQAANYATASADPITGQQIANYQDPFTQQVVDATQHDFDVQNQRQQSGVVGNARIQGSLGGDREAVAQALTAEAQNRTQDPIIANLRSQGYNTALGAAGQDKARQGQAAYTLGNLSTTNLSGLLGLGQLAQGQEQNVLNAGSANAAAQTAYPYQNLQFLTGIDTALGGASGATTTGSSATQGPTPNTWSQLAGLGLGAAALLATGGRVPEKAAGGGLSSPFQVPGYIPQMQFQANPIQAPHLSMASPSMPADGGFGSHMSDIKSMTNGFKGILDGGKKAGEWARTTPGSDASGGFSTTVNPEGMSGWGNYLSSAMPDMGGISGGLEGLGTGISSGLSGIGAGVGAAGAAGAEGLGALMAFLNRGGRVPGYAEGGEIEDVLDDAAGQPQGLSIPAGIAVSQAPAVSGPVSLASVDGPAREIAPRDHAAAPYATLDGWGGTVEREPGQGVAPARLAPPASAASEGGFSLPGAVQGVLDRINPAHWDDTTRAGLLQAGLGMMAAGHGGPGSFLQNVGEGGLKGATAYQALDQAAKERAMNQQRIDQAAKELQMRADREALATLKSPYEIQHLTKQNELIDQQIAEGKKKLVPTAYDALGKPTAYAEYEPATHKFTPLGPQQGAAGDTSMLTGDEFLATVPANIRAQVKKIAEYDAPPLPGQRGVGIMNMVAQYRPEYDAKDYGARNAALKAFKAGKSADNITSMETAIGHLESLSKAAEGLNNWDTLPILNRPINAVAGAVSGDVQARQKAFDVNRNAVASELAKVFKGTGTTDVSSVKEWEHAVSQSDSPTALRTAVAKATELLYSRMAAVAGQYERATGQKIDPVSLIKNDHAREALRKLNPALFGEVGAGTDGGEANGKTEVPVAPSRPNSVPSGSLFSPSRKMWKAPDGSLYDETGGRVQ